VLPVDVKDAWRSGSFVTTGALVTVAADDDEPLAEPLVVTATGVPTTDEADELDVLAGVFNWVCQV
jgi:hypothetical protein